MYINHGLLYWLIIIVITFNVALLQILQDLSPLIFITTYEGVTLSLLTRRGNSPEKWINLSEVTK